MKNLTQAEAYAAMFAFLEQRYHLTGSDELGALLGGMALLEDGNPADPAVAREWHDAIARALRSKVSVDLKLK